MARRSKGHVEAKVRQPGWSPSVPCAQAVTEEIGLQMYHGSPYGFHVSAETVLELREEGGA